MNRLIAVLSPLLLLAACGGGGANDPVTISTSPIQVTASATVHRIQLGPISGGSVRVVTPGLGIVLYAGATDSEGYFTIDTGAVRQAWEKLSPRPDYAWVISSGGMDTDPNDDGIKEAGEAVVVRGEVKGIVPIASLLNEKNIRISLLSSAIADVLGDTKDLTEVRIVEVARQLNFPDVDRDGKITISDVLFYEMGSKSGLENSLRTFYLNAIHTGDSAARRQFVQSALVDLLPIRIEKVQAGDVLQLKLFKLGASNTIYYGTSAATNGASLPSVYVDGSTISLTVGQKLYFNECTSALVCSQTQAVLWDGTSTRSFIAAPGGIIGNVYQDTTYLDNLTLQINALDDKFNSLTKEISNAQKVISDSDADITDLTAQIADIDAQVAKLNGQ
jgi:hypothetical protein